MIREFIRSGSNVFLSDLIGKIFGFLLISGLTYLLSPYEFGQYNALFTAATSICMISGLGVPMYLQRTSAVKDDSQGKLGSMISTGLSIMLLSIILLLAVLLVIGEEKWRVVFNDLDKNLILWLPVLSFCYFSVQSPVSVYLGLGLFKSYSVRTIIEAGCTFICVLVGASLAGLSGALAGLSIALGITAIVTAKVLSTAFKRKNVILTLKGFYNTGIQIFRDSTVYFFGNTMLGAISNIILIALFTQHVGYEDFGYLRLAFGIAAIVTVVPNVARVVSVTFIAREGDASENLKSLQIRYLMFAIVLSTTFISLTLPPLVEILFGSEYKSGLHIYAMILYLYVFLNFHQILNGFVAGHGKLIYSGLVNSGMVLLFIALMVVLIPLFGFNGYFIAFGVSHLAGVVVLMRHEVRLDNFHQAVLLKNTILVSLFLILLLIACLTIKMAFWVRLLLQLTLISLYILWHIRYAFSRLELEKILVAVRSKLRLN